MVNNDTSQDPNITQSCPVVRPPAPETTQVPVGLAWKGLVATTAVVMGVGAAVAGVNQVQANSISQWNQIVQLAQNRNVASPAATATGASVPAAVPQPAAPAVAAGATGASATPGVQVPSSNQKSVIDEPVNGIVINDDFVEICEGLQEGQSVCTYNPRQGSPK